METLLEILKLTIPGFIVFLTVWFVIREYFKNQYQIQVLQGRQENSQTTLPLKLQALERLSLFVERISIPTMILRLRDDKISASAFKSALMMTVQQEYEHNITQQVYVSNELWQIIKFTKDEVINIINMIAADVEPDASSKELIKILFNFVNEKGDALPNHQALLAIKKEASLF